MRRGSLIWGLIIIVAGILLLLDNMGLLPVNAWTVIWPLALILLGLWFLLGPRLWRGKIETRQLSIPLENARRAEVQINHGAGKLDFNALNMPGQLLSGTFGGGVEETVNRSGDNATVRLSAPSDAWMGPDMWAGNNQGFSWQVGFSPDVEMRMVLKTGASESRLDLSALRVTDFRLETGASSTYITLPQNAGATRAEIHAGAASVNILVPMGVAARIRTQTGLSSAKVDTMRFPVIENNIYQSPDYSTASNRVEIYVEAGVGSIDIR